ncbi:hypothetical protein V8E55_007036, partial [Tylopilus felleus]
VLKKVMSSLAVDVCLHNRTPTPAIELLEQGRGVLEPAHSPPLTVSLRPARVGKKLADEFACLTSLVHSAPDSPGTDQHDQVCHLSVKLMRVVTKIRELPGLSHSLLPQPFCDLQRAASGGPPVVNVSQYSCDSLVGLDDRDPVHI